MKTKAERELARIADALRTAEEEDRAADHAIEALLGQQAELHEREVDAILGTTDPAKVERQRGQLEAKMAKARQEKQRTGRLVTTLRGRAVAQAEQVREETLGRAAAATHARHERVLRLHDELPQAQKALAEAEENEQRLERETRYPARSFDRHQAKTAELVAEREAEQIAHAAKYEPPSRWPKHLREQIAAQRAALVEEEQQNRQRLREEGRARGHAGRARRDDPTLGAAPR